VKVLGIGNAIVDVICKVEESFITKNNLTKGTMKLVDEAEFKKLDGAGTMIKNMRTSSVTSWVLDWPFVLLFLVVLIF